jgi:predicted Zn-dependent peptidase
MLNRKIKPKTNAKIHIHSITPSKIKGSDVEIFYKNNVTEDIIILKLFYPLNALDVKNYLLIELLGNTLHECGTEKYTFKELVDAYSYHGINFRLSSTPSFLEITGSCIRSQFDKLLYFLDQIVYNPRFDIKEFKKTKQKAKENFKINMQDSSFIADLLKNKYMFGDNSPYGFVPKESDYDNLDIEDIKSIYQDKVAPRKPLIAVTGNLKMSELENLENFISKKNLKNVNFDTGIKYTEFATQQTFINEVKQDLVQSSLRIFSLLDTPHYYDEEYFNLQISNFIFGGPFFNARLIQVLREKKGYTYGIYSNLEDYNSHALSIEIKSETKQGSEIDAIKSVFKEMINLSHSSLQKKLIPMTKIILKTILAEQLENKFSQMNYFIHTYIKGIDPQTAINVRLSCIEKFNQDTLVQIAQKYLHPDHFKSVVVSNQKLDQPIL